MVRLPVLLEEQRPVTRGDCLPGGCNEQRPCPWVACKHHLALEVGPEHIDSRGKEIQSIKSPWLVALTGRADKDTVHAWGDRLVDQLEHMHGPVLESCSLDAADRGGMSQEEAAAVLNQKRQRVDQVERVALIRMQAGARKAGLG